MSWSAIVPLKAAIDRKTRLAPVLGPDERIALSQAMARTVIAALAQASGVDRILVLSPEAVSAPGVAWIEDRGTGLNGELARTRDFLGGPTLVIHADLPFLAGADVTAMLGAAGDQGVALARDRRGEGTNAIAIADARPFRFAFGAWSFRAHSAQGPCVTVQRPGLALDIDVPEDLRLAQTLAGADWRDRVGAERAGLASG